MKGFTAARLTTLVLLATVAATAQPAKPSPMNTIAERYVKLVLAVGQHDADYVDAFYGPPEWKTEAERLKRPLGDIDAAAERLIAEIPAPSDADRRDELAMLRREYLSQAARGAPHARAHAAGRKADIRSRVTSAVRR